MSPTRIEGTSPLAATLPLSAGEPDASRVVAVLDAYLTALKEGRSPDRNQLLADHPEIATQLEACLAGLEFIHRSSAEMPADGKRLGDFRILREIGHGGMGAVYEAEQISLGRRIALKVLRFGPVSDPEAITRFQREAETVARLHHTNIVPIFAVGSEGGVNYYAMQYIVGRSLDHVLRAAGKPIAPKTVAEWGLQAAEALAHAHARDVIHRDVKPSNLLLDDEEGRIWLTDFGLAKRSDDVTLSLTGALLGTPRYMSPEQAMAAHHKLDHRTDLYSLGATLYELATNKPVFSGNSAHDVIMQILGRDVEPPRKHVPSLPRDLDTILMKCLAKEPSRRYASSRDLANDLRAFLDNRVIAARRESYAELATRWFQKQKKSVALTMFAAAGTLVAVLLAAMLGYAWHRSRLATVILKTDAPPLVAEILDASGTPVMTNVSLPTLDPVEMPAGKYTLRLTGRERLSQSHVFDLKRGTAVNCKLDLEDQVLWRDVQLEHGYRLAKFHQWPKPDSGDHAARPLSITDPVCFTGAGLRVVRGGKTRFEISLREPQSPLLKDSMVMQWPWPNGPDFVGEGQFDMRPWVLSTNAAISQAFDLNQDGTSDFILAAQHQPWVIAMSGSNGEPLWTAARGSAVKQPNENRTAQIDLLGAVATEPVIVADQNGDGRAEIAASFIQVSEDGQGIERWVELLSGASGESLWRCDIPAEPFNAKPARSTPYALSWFHGMTWGYGSMGGSMSATFFHYSVRQGGNFQRTGNAAYRPSRLVELRGTTPQLGCIAGAEFLTLDLKTGTAKSQSLPFRPESEPHYGDCDGDGATDAVLLVTDATPTTVQNKVIAWSPSKGQMLWTHDVQTSWTNQNAIQLPLPRWPLVEDLNGDGACEVIVPETSSLNGPMPSAPHGTLVAIDGKSGKPSWRARLMNSDQQLDHFIAGPDLDGDGKREIFVATLWSSKQTLFVDALSGANGETLWRTSRQLLNTQAEQGDLYLAELVWTAVGEDGWPQLAVAVNCTSGDAIDHVCLLSAGTGEVAHLAPGVSAVHPADLDSDSAEDLILLSKHGGGRHNGRLQGVRHATGEVWRSPLPHQVVVGDLNDDGVRDLVSILTFTGCDARCGRTGELLWNLPIDVNSFWNATIHPAAEHDPRTLALPNVHDLDKDGTPDLLLVRGMGYSTTETRPFLMAVSGRTGKTLWTCDASGSQVELSSLVDCRDLDGDGAVEVIVAAAADWARSPSSVINPPRNLRLFVFEGNTGRTRWFSNLTQQQGNSLQFQQLVLEIAYRDLNQDGALDLVLPAQLTPEAPQLAMRALGGKDGAVLWNFPLPADRDLQDSLGNVPPAVCGDLDGDGNAEVIAMSFETTMTATGSQDYVRVDALAGKSGEPRWSWKKPVQKSFNRVDSTQAFMNGRLRPVLLRRADGKQWIAVLTSSPERALDILNERGEVVSTIAPGGHQLDTRSRLWPLDGDGDGNEDVLHASHVGIGLMRADDLSKPIWKRSISGQVDGLLPTSAPGRIVFTEARFGSSLVGLEPATGREVWQIVSRGDHLGASGGNRYLLAWPSANSNGYVLVQSDDLRCVRQTIPLDQAQKSKFTSRIALASLALDPRLVRPLPWMTQSEASVGAGVKFFAWTLFYTLTLLASPLAYLYRLARERRWGLKTFLMLPLISGMFLMGCLIHGSDNDFHTLLGKFSIALMIGTPWVFSIGLIACWLWRRKLRATGIWLLVGAVIGGVMLAATAMNLFFETIEPGERWAWQGWYWIFVPAYFILCWLTLIGIPLDAARRWIWARWLGHTSAKTVT